MSVAPARSQEPEVLRDPLDVPDIDPRITQARKAKKTLFETRRPQSDRPGGSSFA
jgi:hypothetical protein